ncbi:unnamed protein product [Acanthoscelides obtectus]|uniref:Uncharacterized protein n=1 Tax=Acanthoscelides obtectus TaxID=200917 RepID=A0A9P0PNR5_ACAOB|nr:unnamed protein product [Acanthoscelides obtectus]CAK1626555.1 hypothetical protein AOBTE_LOCUS3926 [Acanthoscelides obtectus]
MQENITEDGNMQNINNNYRENAGTAQNQEIRTIANNDKNTEVALKQEIKSLNEKIELLSELLAEKDRLVHQLSNENRRFQEHYDLLATKVVEKDTIISKLRIGIDKVKNCRNGAVEINVQDFVRTQLKQKIEKNMPTSYKISEPRMFKPKIQIVGYRSEQKLAKEQYKKKL